MSPPTKISKADARRALILHQFRPQATQVEAFQHLRSIQFDPIAPAGCNHDLVLHARVPGYKIGDWEKLAYDDRRIYDGWDKQASLVPFEGWPARRIFHKRHPDRYDKVFKDHADAVTAILKELEERGPLMPSECELQERKEEWKGSWHGPNLSKQVMRALWGTGQVMTSGRRKGHHIYDLTERVVPPEFYRRELSDRDAANEVFRDRHHAIGLLRPSAPYECWSYYYAPERQVFIDDLLADGSIVPVNVDGQKAHCTPTFLELLDKSPLEPRVIFVAPLDQLLWDRKLINHLFDFDYVWEIYMHESKRKWGYYVLPVLNGNDLVARIEFFCRKGTLEIRQWHVEDRELGAGFEEAFVVALQEFMRYCSATKVEVAAHVDAKIRKLAIAAEK